MTSPGIPDFSVYITAARDLLFSGGSAVWSHHDWCCFYITIIDVDYIAKWQIPGYANLNLFLGVPGDVNGQIWSMTSPEIPGYLVTLLQLGICHLAVGVQHG